MSDSVKKNSLDLYKAKAIKNCLLVFRLLVSSALYHPKQTNVLHSVLSPENTVYFSVI